MDWKYTYDSYISNHSYLSFIRTYNFSFVHFFFFGHDIFIRFWRFEKSFTYSWLDFSKLILDPYTNFLKTFLLDFDNILFPIIYLTYIYSFTCTVEIHNEEGKHNLPTMWHQIGPRVQIKRNPDKRVMDGYIILEGLMNSLWRVKTRASIQPRGEFWHTFRYR